MAEGKRGSLAYLAGASVAALLWAGATPALAQEAGGSQGEAEAPADADIIVTGTRVNRSGFTAPTPQTVLGIDELEARAPANLANVVNDLPQLSPTVSPGTTLLGVGGGTGGANILNLRGLGINRTLVLLNGNRVVPSTTTGGVDVNTLPQGLVKRVDVVTGGASAAWGSDAVAGVVNFVLDTGFTGLKVNAQAGSSFRGDAETYSASLTFGTSFAGGRGHFLFDVSGTQQGGIAHYSDRDWYKGWKIVNNPAYVAGNGQPRQLVSTADFLAASAGGVIISGARAFNTQFDANGNPVAFDPGRPTSPYKIGGTHNDISDGYPLLVPVKYASGFGRLSYELSDGVDAYLEGSYAASTTENTTASYPAIGLLIAPDNAFLPASLAGGAPFLIGKVFESLGEPRPRNDREVIRGLVGVDAKLGGSWTAKAYYQYGTANILNQVSNDPIIANVARAIDAVRNPAGQIVCRSTLTAPTNGCVPLNPFGTQPANPAAIAYVNGLSIQHIKLQQHAAALTLQGEPFSLWAGPVSFAAGVEYRSEEYRADADALSIAGSFWVGNYKPGRGKYNVKEAFAEVVVPLLRDAPVAKSLDLNLAGRVTDYSVSGTVGTYKAGLTWDVVDGIRLRGTHSRDIRAPNLNDLFLGGQVNTQIINDPRTNTSVSVLQVTSGNLALVPEIASADTVGLVLQPRFIPGLSLSVDYYRTSIKGAITSLIAQQIVNNCQAGLADFCGAVVRNAAGVITQVNASGFNANSEKLEGIDYELAYAHELGGGRMTLRLLATNTLKRTITTTNGTLNNLGMMTGGHPPKWRWFNTLTYEVGASRTQLAMRGVSDGVLDNAWKTGVDIDNNKVKGASYFDLSQSFKIDALGADAELYGIVENLFDKDPSVAAYTGFLFPGTTAAYFDTIGRRFRIGFRVKY